MKQACSPERRKPESVLIVDDEESTRDLLRNLLEKQGFKVSEAADGDTATQVAGAERPDVILLDVMMPGVDGNKVCRRLKGDAQTASIPVLMITGLKDREDRLRGIEAGADDFLTKPVDREEVLLRVRNACQRKRLFDELQENYSQLRELEALRDNLTQMIVNDMRRPLTGIEGFLRLVRMEAERVLSREHQGYIDGALHCVTELQTIVYALFDVKRLEDGALPLNLGPCELRGVAQRAIDSMGPDAGRVQFRKPAGSVWAHCDADIICRVIRNLLDNALTRSPAEEGIHVSIEAVGARARVSVQDSAPAIPPAEQARVFEKLAQAEDAREGQEFALGLGLTFCKLAVEAHGGAIAVVGPEPGKATGNTFRLELPAASPDSAR